MRNADDGGGSRDAAGRAVRIHRAAIDWLNQHPDSRGFRGYLAVRVAALTFPVPGERVTIRQILRMARPALRRDRIQIDIHLSASDFHASARVYKAVGFHLVYDDGDPLGGSPCYVGHLGPTQLLLHQVTPTRPASRGIRLGFRVDDFETAVLRLAAAEIPLERPVPKNFVQIYDPDGNKIVLTRRRRRR